MTPSAAVRQPVRNLSSRFLLCWIALIFTLSSVPFPEQANAVHVGDPCLICGYPSTYQFNTAQRLSCARPENGGTGDLLPTGKSVCNNNPRMFSCNPLVYGTDPNRKPYCLPLNNQMTVTVSMLAEERRTRNAQAFAQDLEAWIQSTPGLREPHQLEDALKKLELKMTPPLNNTLPKKMVENFKLAGRNLNATKFELERHRNQMVTEALALAVAPAPATPVEGVAGEAVENVSPLPTTSNPLGFLSCIENGLNQAIGQSDKPVSSRYIALLAVAEQAAQSGHFDVQSVPQHRTLMLQKVISRIQQYGYCDSESYPPLETRSALEQSQFKSWLTSDNGRVKGHFASPQYIIRTTLSSNDDSVGRAEAQDMFRRVFFIGDFANKVKPMKPTNAFRKESHLEGNSFFALFPDVYFGDSRQHSPVLGDAVDYWENADANKKMHGKEWLSCQKNALKRIRKPKGPFALNWLPEGHAYRAPKAEIERRRGTRLEYSKREQAELYERVPNIHEANKQVCLTMAKTCGLTETDFCMLSIHRINRDLGIDNPIDAPPKQGEAAQ